MHRTWTFALLAAVSPLCALDAHAARRVAVAFESPPASAEYSQAVSLAVSFVDDDGAALDGLVACGDEPCRVSVTMRPADGSGETIFVTEPDVVVDAAGRARARLTLVDGRHGGATFATDAEGFAYTLTARFAGIGTPRPDDDDVDCQPEAVGADDGRLCPAQASTVLAVFPEVPALVFSQDVVMSIGDTVTLAVTLTDENGNATGDTLDGPGPLPLSGLPVRFAYDVNGNGGPDFQDGELLGEAVTNDSGVAAFSFTADPSFVVAGDYDTALHAEFPGDDRYALARTSTGLVVRARGPDAARTIVEVDPTTIEANGVDTATVTVKLVDRDGNLLGPDSDPHTLAVTTDLGILRDDVERSPLDGFYRQKLQAQRKPGTATIRVTVDGDDAGEVALVLAGNPGGCTCASSSPGDGVLCTTVTLLFLVRRRRSRVING
jgi:hypothetical protein